MYSIQSGSASVQIRYPCAVSLSREAQFYPRRCSSHRQPSSTNSIMQMKPLRQHANVEVSRLAVLHSSVRLSVAKIEIWPLSERNPDKVSTKKKAPRPGLSPGSLCCVSIFQMAPRKWRLDRYLARVLPEIAPFDTRGTSVFTWELTGMGGGREG